MRAVYLTGASIYLRAMLASDKDQAAAWFDSPFPIDATKAEQFLKEAHQDLESQTHYLAVARRDDDVVVGGVALERYSRHVTVSFHFAPTLVDADELRAETLRLLVPWLRDERESLIVEVSLAADQPVTIAAAEAMSLRAMVRLREAFARPGSRTDCLIYQWYHPSLEVEEAHA